VRRLILVGGGHAHLAVLRALAERRPSKLEVLLVSPAEQAIYSGMVPGWMAGHYPLAACSIDLRPLCEAAGARMIVQGAASIDAGERRVTLADGSLLEYDVASIDVGSETEQSWLGVLGDRLLPVRPIQRFMQRWTGLLQAAAAAPGFRLVVVGGGAAGIELAFAARHAFESDQLMASVMLVTSERGLLPGHAARAAKVAGKWLTRQGITVLVARAVGVESGVVLSTGKLLRADCVIAASGARAPEWLRSSGLALDADGYILVDPMHRSVSHPSLFAAGDVCARPDSPLARSGVYAVRAGPVLAHNLVATLTNGSLRPYHPRRRSLYLLATRPGHAILSWGPVVLSGQWVWRLKDWIDRRFIGLNTRVSVTPADRVYPGKQSGS
jgi:pyridine nucleotide-disulfide oxidoreductase family protein